MCLLFIIFPCFTEKTLYFLFLLWFSITHGKSNYVYLFTAANFFLPLSCVCMCLVCNVHRYKFMDIHKNYVTIYTKFIQLNDNYSLRFIRIICMCDDVLLSNMFWTLNYFYIKQLQHMHTHKWTNTLYFSSSLSLSLSLTLSLSLCLKEFVLKFPLSLSLSFLWRTSSR